MPVPLYICQICLRTDKKLIAIGKALSEYYDELAEYCLDATSPLCCMECEHMLMKSYCFKRKCLAAATILQKWMTTKSNAKKPIDSLHTLIPQSTMGIWIEDNNKIFTMCHEEVLEQPEENNGTIPNNTIKLEKDDSDSEMPLQDIDNLKTENATTSLHEDLIVNDSLNNIEKTEEKETLIFKIERDNENEEPEELELVTDSFERDDVNEQPEELEFVTDSFERDDENEESEELEIVPDSFERDEESESESVGGLELPDEASLNSDDDYDYGKEIEEGGRKKSLKKLANKALSSDNETEFVIETKLKKMIEDIEAIYKEWENTSILKRKRVDREYLKAQRSPNKKGTLAQLASISSDLDTIHESCVKIINYEEGLEDPKQRSSSASQAQDGYHLARLCSTCGDSVTEAEIRLHKCGESMENSGTIPNNTIKLEKDDSDSEMPLQNIDNLKTENATTSVHEDLIVDDSLNNIEKTEEKETFMIYKKEIFKIESDNENVEPEELELVTDSFERDDENEESEELEIVPDSFERDEESESESKGGLELPDEASLNSNDDYDYGKEIKEGGRKKSLKKLANKALSSDDETEFVIETKLNKMIEDKEAIYKEWKNTSILKRKRVDKEYLKFQRSHNKKGTLAQLANISSDLDTIHESCVKIINYEEGLQDPKQRSSSASQAQDGYHRARLCSTCGDSVTEAEIRLHKCGESMNQTNLPISHTEIDYRRGKKARLHLTAKRKKSHFKCKAKNWSPKKTQPTTTIYVPCLYNVSASNDIK